jgi:hypothetical protein
MSILGMRIPQIMAIVPWGQKPTVFKTATDSLLDALSTPNSSPRAPFVHQKLSILRFHVHTTRNRKCGSSGNRPDGILSAPSVTNMKSAAAYMIMRRPRQAPSAGIALAEVVIGMALILIVLGMVFAMNGQLLRLLNQGKQSAYATQLIAERVEQLRTCGWKRLTTPSLLEDEVAVVQRDTATSTNLPGVTEIIHIEPYYSPAGRFVHLVRSAAGTTPSGVAIDGETLVKVSITVQWTTGKRQRERNFVTVISPYRREQPDEA